jgi:uncharacterized protein (UPF0303 family)
MSTDQNTTSVESDAAKIEALESQERALVLPGFDETIAYEIGVKLRERAAAVAAPVVIEIRSAARRFFFAALPGSAPDNEEWARRKANTVLRCHAASLLVGLRLAAKGRSQWPDAALDMKDYSVHGGGFPVRVRAVGVVAVIAISGLPSREDHDMIVSTLAAWLHVRDLAPTQ